MAEYSELTGRDYAPGARPTTATTPTSSWSASARSPTTSAPCCRYLRAQGMKVGVVSVKLLQPFPEAELVAALAGKKAVTVLERSRPDRAHQRWSPQALFKARENADRRRATPGIPALADTPAPDHRDLRPRRARPAAAPPHRRVQEHGRRRRCAPLIYLGSQFFEDHPRRARGRGAGAAARRLPRDRADGAARPSPTRVLLPAVGDADPLPLGRRLRHHRHRQAAHRHPRRRARACTRKSAPKYGSEKSGAPTNYYITLSPEPVLITNAELEDVEVVISPDHKVFIHTNPLKGLVEGGTFILQSNLSPEEVWRELPAHARQDHPREADPLLRRRRLRGRQAARPDPRPRDPHDGHRLHRRGRRRTSTGSPRAPPRRRSSTKVRAPDREEVRRQGRRRRRGQHGGHPRRHRGDPTASTTTPRSSPPSTTEPRRRSRRAPSALSAAMCRARRPSATSGLFDPAYYEDIDRRAVPRGHHRRGAGAARHRPVHAGRHRRRQGQGPVPPRRCRSSTPTSAPAAWSARWSARTPPSRTRCTRSTTCCSPAINQLDVTEPQREALRGQVYARRAGPRDLPAEQGRPRRSTRSWRRPRPASTSTTPSWRRNSTSWSPMLATYPVARTRPFFDAMEKDSPGTGGLFAATIDPWKCTGCLECIDVCGPGALTSLRAGRRRARRAAGALRVPEQPRRTRRPASSRARPRPTATSSA